MATYVIGDIHGAAKALKQVLERSNFDYENDTLIQLGDVADGWSEVYECVEELLKIKNLISIKGNHDDWFFQWMIKGLHPTNWLQGGYGTLQSYVNNVDRNVNIRQRMGAYTSDLTYFDIPDTHKDFWTKQHLYYKDDKNRVFVHGGYTSIHGIGNDESASYYWDRSLWYTALAAGSTNKSLDNRLPITLRNHEEIYIGHTSTVNWDYKNHGVLKAPKGEVRGKPITTPIHACNVWNLDTGAGFRGKLTIMNIDTKEFWQSDFVNELYPDEKGR